MASKIRKTSVNKLGSKESNKSGVVIVLPLLLVSTFSFGYMSFQSSQIAEDKMKTLSSSSERVNATRDQEINSVTLPEAQTLSPVEKPASETTTDAVVPGGSVDDANRQTGATQALQGSQKAPVETGPPDNERLQAPMDSIKVQMRSVFNR